MDAYEVTNATIREKQRKLEQLENNYRTSCHQIEKRYEDLYSKRDALMEMIDTKHRVSHQSLLQSEEDVTEEIAQLNRIASTYSQVVSSSFVEHGSRIEREKEQLEASYKKEHRLLEKDIDNLYRQKRQLELNNERRK